MLQDFTNATDGIVNVVVSYLVEILVLVGEFAASDFQATADRFFTIGIAGPEPALQFLDAAAMNEDGDRVWISLHDGPHPFHVYL